MQSLLAALGLVFLAELGDKTMLATATLAAQGNPVLTWIGATIGICLSGAVGCWSAGRSVLGCRSGPSGSARRCSSPRSARC